MLKMDEKKKCYACKGELKHYRMYVKNNEADILLKCIDCNTLYEYRYDSFIDYCWQFIRIWDTIKHWSTGVEQYWANRIDYRFMLERVQLIWGY